MIRHLDAATDGNANGGARLFVPLPIDLPSLFYMEGRGVAVPVNGEPGEVVWLVARNGERPPREGDLGTLALPGFPPCRAGVGRIRSNRGRRTELTASLPTGGATMTLSRTLPLVLLFFAVAAARGQEPASNATSEANTPDRANAARGKVTAEEREREHARAEFIGARSEFADLLVSALTSEQLAEKARRISAEIGLRRAEDRLGEVRERLDEVEAAGRADTDEARRLRERAAALDVEVQRLRRPGADPQAGESARLAAQAVAKRLRTAMAEETDYLADVLGTRELQERAQRLRRIVTLARIAGGLRSQQEAPQRKAPERAGDDASTVVPAGATSEPEDGTLGDESLGGAVTAPPELPGDAGPKQADAQPKANEEQSRDD